MLNLRNLITKDVQETVIKLKHDDYKGLNDIYKKAEVKEVKYLKNSIKVKIVTNKKNKEFLEKKN